MSIFDAYIRLEGTLSGSIRCDEPMARHTSYRIGGPAALFVECASVSDLALTLDVLAEEDVAWSIVGKGSNPLRTSSSARMVVGFRGSRPWRAFPARSAVRCS